MISDITSSFVNKFPEANLVEHRGETSLSVPNAQLHEAVQFLKQEQEFNILKDICAVDWYKRNPRFEVGYNLYSLSKKTRLRLKTFCTAESPKVLSICDLFSAANWYEREVYDMHGIVFLNHPDLRRMYMPDDFKDPISGEPLYPLRKDFPVMGIPGAMPLPQRN